MYNLRTISKLVALFSFVFGTILFSLFIYLGESYISIYIGVKYVIITLIINFILFMSNLLSSAVHNEKRIDYLKTCGIMLLNIPIAILYLYIIISIQFPPKG